jgi:hypothetical protein
VLTQNDGGAARGGDLRELGVLAGVQGQVHGTADTLPPHPFDNDATRPEARARTALAPHQWAVQGRAHLHTEMATVAAVLDPAAPASARIKAEVRGGPIRAAATVVASVRPHRRHLSSVRY